MNWPQGFGIACRVCGTFCIGATEDDVIAVLNDHTCPKDAGTWPRQPSNETLAFGFPVEPKSWRSLLTVEDARLLHSMRIDPL